MEAEHGMNSKLPRLYSEFSSWWPLMSAPEEYEDEAAQFHSILQENVPDGLGQVVEFGSGGGHNAFHLKRHFAMTLVDVSPGMLQTSRVLNPECEHIEADMRTVRLGRTFDAVFIHDAIMHMTTQEDLSAAIETAFAHCRPGGMALFVPDNVREDFSPSTTHCGTDGESLGMRCLAWTHPPRPDEDTFRVDMAYLLKDEKGHVSVAHDHFILGLFTRATWLELLRRAGFEPSIREDIRFGREIFIASKP